MSFEKYINDKYALFVNALAEDVIQKSKRIQELGEANKQRGMTEDEAQELSVLLQEQNNGVFVAELTSMKIDVAEWKLRNKHLLERTSVVLDVEHRVGVSKWLE